MKKTIALMLAMLFAVCAFATTAYADPETTTTTTAATTTTTTAATTTTTTAVNDPDAPNDGFDPTTTTTTTAAATTTTTTTAAGGTTTTTTTTAAGDTTTTTDAPVTNKPGETAYEGQDQEGKPSTTKKPAAVDPTIPSTGSGIVVPAIALAVLAAGTVAVIKTKKED